MGLFCLFWHLNLLPSLRLSHGRRLLPQVLHGFFPDQAMFKPSQYSPPLQAGPSSHPAVDHGIGRMAVTIFPKLFFTTKSEGSRARCAHQFHSWHWIPPSCPQAVLPLSLSQLTDFHTAHLSRQNGFLWKPVLLKMFYPALIMSSSLSALDESQIKLFRKWRNLGGRRGKSVEHHRIHEGIWVKIHS